MGLFAEAAAVGTEGFFAEGCVEGFAAAAFTAEGYFAEGFITEGAEGYFAEEYES